MFLYLGFRNGLFVFAGGFQCWPCVLVYGYDGG